MMRSIIPKSYRSKTRFVRVGECANNRLPVTIVGTGEPVLLIHAYGMDAREFIPFLLPLTSKYQFFLPHMRGFGLAESMSVTKFDFLSEYADDVDAVINKICAWREVDSVPVAAISMGAQIMWSYFTHYGSSKVSRYLNIDQPPIITNKPDWRGGLFGERQDEIFGIFRSLLDAGNEFEHVDDFAVLPHDLKRYTRDTERMFSMLSIGRPRSQAFVYIKTHQTDRKLATFDHKIWKHKMRCLRAYLEIPYDFRDTAEKLDIPVTNLIGARSKLYDKDWQRKVTEMLPNATEVVLEKSGHAVPLDTPVGFYRTLKQFAIAS